MKPLLKQYLAWGVVVLFVVAAAVDYGGQFFGEGFQEMDIKIPSLTLFVISVRHWAFLLPVATLVLTIVLYPRVRSEGVLLHLFGGMMFVALAMIMILSVAIILPMFAMRGFGGGGE